MESKQDANESVAPNIPTEAKKDVVEEVNNDRVETSSITTKKDDQEDVTTTEAEDIEEPGRPKYWKTTWDQIKKYRDSHPAPVDAQGAHRCAKSENEKEHRFETLVALLLSSQTKDQHTYAAVANLRENLGPEGDHKLTPDTVIEATHEQIDNAIHSVGFHSQKATYLKRIAEILKKEHGGDVPLTLAGWMELPGIGRKMGVLGVQICWNEPTGVSADVHVTRIAKRLGWAKSTVADKVAVELEGWLPKDRWIDVNPLLVGFGQTLCGSIPKCTICPVTHCPSRKGKKSKPL